MTCFFPETTQAPTGSVAMMQIDCEVFATKLVHVDKSTLPVHLRENATHLRHDSTFYGTDQQPVPHRWGAFLKKTDILSFQCVLEWVMRKDECRNVWTDIGTKRSCSRWLWIICGRFLKCFVPVCFRVSHQNGRVPKCVDRYWHYSELFGVSVNYMW